MQSRILTSLVIFPMCATLLRAQPVAQPEPAVVLGSVIGKVISIAQPWPNAAPKTFSTRLKIVKAEGLPSFLAGMEADIAFQSPDRLRVVTKVDGQEIKVGRQGQQLWVSLPQKKFSVVGESGLPRYLSAPDKRDTTQMRAMTLGVNAAKLVLLPLALDIELLPPVKLNGVDCQVLDLRPKPDSKLGVPDVRVRMWVRRQDQMPVRISATLKGEFDVLVELADPKIGVAWPVEKWALDSKAGDNVERVALGHLTRFIDSAIERLNTKLPTLGPATGARRVIAVEGEGRLEELDGTKVLFLKGTPEEMGRQHGQLLRQEIRSVIDNILYGVGVGSSFSKGRWFFGEIEAAEKRLAPHVNPRYWREMDAMAQAAGVDVQEARLANLFPELFHCSGFAVFGKATAGGRMFHGRILDYMKGAGLEQNAVVMILQPEKGHAWANVSYAGFVGTVTAMNEKQIAIGEMGGRGEGEWDGKPMAQLLRDVMEQAATLEEAVAILRKGPRTCEYYYVVSDAKTKRAVGIAATPTRFETIWAGESHPQLPQPVKDTVLMSAGDRYEELVRRVKAGYGKLDATAARELMARPVCMESNIHSVLFAPDTLDFWVANADSKNVASATRYTKYNLRELLGKAPAAPPAKPALSGALERLK